MQQPTSAAGSRQPTTIGSGSRMKTLVCEKDTEFGHWDALSDVD